MEREKMKRRKIENENLEDQLEALERDPKYREWADEGTSYDQLLDSEYVLSIAPEFVEHVEAVLQKLSKRAIRKIIDRQILIFAPGKKFTGLCLDLPAYEDDRVLLYLSPELANGSVDQIRHTIAHELAHVVLGHSEEPPSPEAKIVGEICERDADQLAAQWGFPRPAGKDSPTKGL
jgi:hypothetical protein